MRILPFHENEISLDLAKNSRVIATMHGQVAITNAESECPVHFTFGAGPCGILHFYNRSNKHGLMTHIAPFTDYKSLPEFLAYIRNKQSDLLELTASGANGSEEFADQIMHFVKSIQGISIVRSKMGTGLHNNSDDMLADTRTGNYYTKGLFDAIPFDSTIITQVEEAVRDYDLSLERKQKNPLKLIYCDSRLPGTRPLLKKQTTYIP